MARKKHKSSSNSSSRIQAIPESMQTENEDSQEESTQPNAAASTPTQAPSKPEPQQTTTMKTVSSHQGSFFKGLMLILSASLLFSFQNVVTRVILSPSDLFGLFPGIILQGGLDNSLLILVLRTAIVLPIMIFLVAPRIHKNTWTDIKDLNKPENRSRFYSSIASGVFLFVSQLCIYIALGAIPAGIATTIFFIYPTITILLMWTIYKDRPSAILILAMLTIYIGGFMAIPEAAFNLKSGQNANFILGAGTAAFSGIAFAGYVVMIKSAKMHPAPFTIINFAIILFLGFFTLLLMDWKVDPTKWTELLLGTLILAGINLLGYLLNNSGVPIVGPAFASVIAASGPAATALMGFIFIAEKLSMIQTLGVFLVTLWVVGISIENMKRAAAAASAPPKK